MCQGVRRVLEAPVLLIIAVHSVFIIHRVQKLNQWRKTIREFCYQRDSQAARSQGEIVRFPQSFSRRETHQSNQPSRASNSGRKNSGVPILLLLCVCEYSADSGSETESIISPFGTRTWILESATETVQRTN